MKIPLTLQGLLDDFSIDLERIVVRLTPHAAMRIGMEKDLLANRLLSIKVTDRIEVNGITKTSNNWKTFNIEVYFGLLLFFYEMVILLAGRVGILQQNGQIETTKLSLGDITPKIRSLLKSFWEGDFSDFKGLNIHELSDNQKLVGYFLNRSALAFIVAHEFGHIIIQLSPGTIEEVKGGILTARDLLPRMRGLSEETNRDLATKWGQEFGADIIGFKLMLMCEEHDERRLLCYLATEMVFIIMKMVDSFYKKNYKETLPYTSHPPPHLRLSLLRSVCASNPPQVLQSGKAIEQLANSLISNI